MDKASGKLTVYFEEPFWVGVFERIEQTGAMHPAGSIAPFVVSSPFHGLRVVPCKLT